MMGRTNPERSVNAVRAAVLAVAPAAPLTLSAMVSTAVLIVVAPLFNHVSTALPMLKDSTLAAVPAGRVAAFAGADAITASYNAETNSSSSRAASSHAGFGFAAAYCSAAAANRAAS